MIFDPLVGDIEGLKESYFDDSYWPRKSKAGARTLDAPWWPLGLVVAWFRKTNAMMP